MRYDELAPAQYAEAMKAVIVGTEGLHARATDVGDRMATIGFGYTLNRNDNVALWRAAGLELSVGAWRALHAIDQAPPSQRTRLGLAFPVRLDREQAEALLIASLAPYESPANSLDLPLSRERVAVVSVAYNRGVGALSRSAFWKALAEGQRAEAWFQLRYFCWGSHAPSEGGLRKRRLAEAQAFGLYDDASTLEVDEAREVYRVFRRHRNAADRIERRWGVGLDGRAGERNLVALANRDYPRLTAAFGRVPELAVALEPAKRTLLAYFQQAHPGLVEAFGGSIQPAGE